LNADEIRECFEKHSEIRYDNIGSEKYHFYEFEKIVNPPSKRQDLCAMLKLAELVQDEGNMISASNNGEIFFDPSFDDLAEAGITDDVVVYLIRCGVRVTDFDCLGMFV